METITNVASTAATTVSNLIYGQPAKDNETAGQEPISGEQGKGTVAEPFDKGNTETGLGTSSTTNPTTTAGKSEDFLKLNPTIGQTTTPESSATTSNTTGPAAQPSLPIVPLVPDSSTLGSTTATTTSTSATGVTDKTGVTDQTWKANPLDEVSTSGAPGAGPAAPSNVTAATPESHSGTATTSEPVGSKLESATDSKVDTHKNTTTTPATTETSGTHGTTGEHKGSVAPSVDAILGKTPKAEHSVPDEEANDPHSKMKEKTVRKADASQPDTTGEAPVVDSSAHKTESNKTDGSAPKTDSSSKSPDHATGEEKDSKVSALKEKLKNKLHIGSKDK